MHNIPTIETQRLRLRAFEGVDLEPYAEMYADDLFVRYLSGKRLTKPSKRSQPMYTKSSMQNLDDGMLRIYPSGPATAGKDVQDSYAAAVQAHLG
jgi:RimJ/RimL family protein N-acetyltransferase